MRTFLEKFVSQQYFVKFKYVVESGKHENSPNLHFHIFGLYNENGSKNFRKRVLIDAWNKSYPNNPLDWKSKHKKGIHCKACCTQEIIDDTYKYMSNESKGNHENYVDLNVSDELGFI